jgi:uncharacterized protein (DUF1810 family)
MSEASDQAFDPERFVSAQEAVMEEVRRELAAGCKRSHWMWFVFPQLRGLGRSATAQYYAIASLAQAEEYLHHALLGARLIECTGLVLGVQGRSITQIFGPPDDMKFRSCMTLFSRIARTSPLFQRALDAYFGGTPDELTLRALNGRG